MLCNYTEVINFIQEQLKQFNYSDQEFSICEMMFFTIPSYHYAGNDSIAFSLITKYISLITSSESLNYLEKLEAHSDKDQTTNILNSIDLTHKVLRHYELALAKYALSQPIIFVLNLYSNHIARARKPA